jgi:diguanylate cyclase (GGDEF)-like protein
MRKKLKSFIFHKYRIILVLTLLLIASFTFTSLVSYNVAKKSILSELKTVTLPLISDNIYLEIQKDLLQPINNTSIMSNDEFLVNWVLSGEQDTDEVVRYLRRIKENYNYFSVFYVSDISNNYYFYDGILKQISPSDEHDVWYYDFVALNLEYDLDVDNDEANDGTMTIFINHRLEDSDGNFLGVTGVGMQLSEVGEMLDSYQQRFGHLIYLIDSFGMIQVHTDLNLVEQVNIHELEGRENLDLEILATDSEIHYYEYHGKQGDVILSARYIPDLDWYLIIEQNLTTTLQSARESMISIVIADLLVTLLFIGLVVVVLNLLINKLEEITIKDDLTGLYNRRKMDDLIQREIAFSKRYGDPLSLIILDVDKFKSVNDTYGHHIGDFYLKRVSDVMQAEIRQIDFLGRWGGEEFIILLPKTTSEQAQELAERLRNSVEMMQIESGQGLISRTISIGISCAKSANMDMDVMIRQADEMMYQSKQEGGNRVNARI